MKQPPTPHDRPSARKGATTAGKGTPLAVEVGARRRFLSTVALFLAGPAIWSAHFMVVYLAVEAGCTGDGPGLDLFDPPAPAVVTLAATVLGAVGCLATAVWAYRRWRADQREPAEGPGLEPLDPGGTMAFAGFLLSLLGIVTVLLVGVPALFLPSCGP